MRKGLPLKICMQSINFVKYVLHLPDPELDVVKIK